MSLMVVIRPLPSINSKRPQVRLAGRRDRIRTSRSGKRETLRMFTSLIALAMVHALAAKPEAIPTWDTDYRHARAVAAKELKPMAIVVGNGSAGWEKLVADGNFLAATTAELRSAYVWVYLDLEQDAGRKLA